MAAAKTLRQTRLKIILSLNMVIMLIVGIMIGSAVGMNGGLEYRVVAEKSDIKEIHATMTDLLKPAISGQGLEDQFDSVQIKARNPIDDKSVKKGELWNEEAITIYQTADVDLCISGSLENLGAMYWQTSNQAVISGFYAAPRTWMGYDANNCRYPMIAATGTTIITAGTYDGLYSDTLTVTVVEVPVEQWKREVLDLVNIERAKNNLNKLRWDVENEEEVNKRTRELVKSYSHTRPDNSGWHTAYAGNRTSAEVVAVGNIAVSPQAVVNMWMASEENRKVLLSPDFKSVAVGMVFDPTSEHKTYWLQYFSAN